MRAYVHAADARAKKGNVLLFRDGKTMQVQESGALVAVVAGPDGQPVRPLKLNKKERRKLRAAARAAAAEPLVEMSTLENPSKDHGGVSILTGEVEVGSVGSLVQRTDSSRMEPTNPCE